MQTDKIEQIEQTEQAEEKRGSSTKQDILFLLKTSGLMTVQDLSKQLGLTGMAIRRHLLALQKERYIQIAFQRRGPRKPTSVYKLSSHADQLFPNQYDRLAIELLEGIQGEFGDPFVEMLLTRRAKKLEQKYDAAVSGWSLEERITELAKIQTEEGYMVHLNRNEDGSYTFVESHCPVSKVASLFRQVCQCELALFSKILNAHVERTECMADGGKKCNYRITELSGIRVLHCLN